MSERLTPRLALLLVLPPLLWAMNAVVGRMMVGQVPPLMLNMLRWLLVLLFLLPVAWRFLASADQRRALRERWLILSVLGLLSVGSYNALNYLALHTSTPLNVTLIAASSPLWTLAIGFLFYQRQPGPRDLFSAACSLAGVMIVLTRGQPPELTRIVFAPGDLLMLLAIVLWCFYSWMLSNPPPSLRSGLPKPGENWAEFLVIQTLFGLGWTFLSAGAEAWWLRPEINWSPQVAAAILFIAIGPSIIAYRSWGIGVARVGPGIAALFNNLTPLFAGLLQGALLGEWPQAFHAVAFALIVSGIVVSSAKR